MATALQSTNPSRHIAPDAETRPVTLWYVGARGGWDLPAATLARHVQSLVDGHGFPPPIPAPVRATRNAGGGLTIAVSAVALHVVTRSTWPRLAVDRWFDQWLPPQDAEALDEGHRRAAAADMDSAARGLRLVGSGRS